MNDDELLGIVDRHFSADDPLPRRLATAARAAIETRRLDAQLAALLSDSLDDANLAAVRSDSTPRMLGFQTGECTVDVEVSPETDGHRLLIQVLPAGSYSLVLDRAAGTAELATDEHGMASLSGLSAGPLRILIQQPTGDIRTEWFTV